MAQKRKNKKRWIYWIAALALLIAAGVVAYLVWDSYFRDKRVDTYEDNVVEVAGDVDDKNDDDTNSYKEEEKGSDENNIEEEVEKEKERIVSYEGVNPNKNDQLTGAITYAGVNGGVLMIRVNIDQYLDGGTCNLSLNGNMAYNDVANIVSNASTATCEGFDVPVNALSSGYYQITIGLSTNDRSGTIIGEVNI